MEQSRDKKRGAKTRYSEEHAASAMQEEEPNAG
jgi:hypothetical protein